MSSISLTNKLLVRNDVVFDEFGDWS